VIGERVEVIWEDIVAHSGWLKQEAFDQPPAVITTIGWLTVDFEAFITVSASYGVDGDIREYNQHITIPRGCIRTINKL
jgi:hypothetical protein